MTTHDFIVTAVREAGDIIRAAQKQRIEVSHKGGDTRDVLTNTDLAVNEFLLEKIRSSYPDHHICSEEGSSEEGIERKACAWAIDPIDGTANFARGIPHFAVCVAFLEFGEPVAGAVYNPITNELFSFEKGKGAFLNDERVAVSSITDPREAYALLHIGRKESLREWGLSAQEMFLSSFKKTMNLGSSALDLCFLGVGRLDVVVYGTLTTQDVAAAVGFVREAGGDVQTLLGAPVTLSPNPQSIIAGGNEKLLRDTLAKLPRLGS